METSNFERTVPSPLNLQEKRQFFAFTNGSDGYLPHLNLASNKAAAKAEVSEVQRSTITSDRLSNKLRLLQFASLMPSLIPQTFISEKA